MTEAEWRAATNCRQMVQAVARSSLNFRRRGRPFRWFAVHALRDLTPFAPIDAFGAALDVAERFLNGDADRPEVERAVRLGMRGYEQYHADSEDVVEKTVQGLSALLKHHPHEAAKDALGTAVRVQVIVSPDARQENWGERWDGITARYAPLLRELVGNPFRPVAFAPAWRTSTAVGIAQAIYDEGSFDRLPILADALQDVGCEDADVLAHCRGDGPHAHGCWVVDGVLGNG